ncbi:OsmC family protein [Carnobacterium sp. ISL-102]|uniref:OsmC family protein n=1 Tax=Carnobacterium sp. ISL-102 TaxID=2819142 RepID=UPI00203639A6|nr:OsmC family protein [Carnobacterium sp. ISL-102]
MESNKMQVSIIWENDFIFSMTNSDGNQLKMDAHMEAGGQKKGLLPMQALLGALAGCVGMDFTAILQPHMDQVNSIEIVTQGTKREIQPKDFTAITVTFIVTGDVPTDKVWRAIKISAEKYCPVAHSLKPDIIYQLRLNGQEILDQ